MGLYYSTNQAAAPTTPSSGSFALYCLSGDKNLYWKDDAGNARKVLYSGGALPTTITANQIAYSDGTNLVGSASLTWDGADFKIATNKFTVAAASGNTVVAGTLGVTGVGKINSALSATGNGLDVGGGIGLNDAAATRSISFYLSNAGKAQITQAATGLEILTLFAGGTVKISPDAATNVATFSSTGLAVTASGAGNYGLTTTNSSAASAAAASYTASNGTNTAAYFGTQGTGYSTYGVLQANRTGIYSAHAAGIFIASDNASGSVNIGVGASAPSVAVVSTTGLAVTGTGSFTGAVVSGTTNCLVRDVNDSYLTLWGGTTSNGAAIYVTGASYTSASTAIIDAAALVYRPVGGASEYFRANSAGFAVTGTGGFTGDVTVASGSTNAKLALGNQSGSYYGFIFQDAGTTGKIRYNSYAAGGSSHGHQWELNATAAMTLDSSGNLLMGSGRLKITTNSISDQNTSGNNVGIAFAGGPGIVPTDGAGIPTDNTVVLGNATYRWSVVYAGTGTINTSDAREKTPVRGLSAAEINAAKQLSGEVGVYQWLSAVSQKGDSARLHIGLTVQRAIEIMESNGLSPTAYGFICYDSWADEFREHPAIEAAAATYDDEGNELMPAVEAKDAWTEQTQTGGDRFSFRMDELSLFIARGIDARLSALES